MQSLSLLKRLFALDDVPVAAGASDLQPDRISRSGEQSLPAAASPHQPGAHPDPPHPDLAHSRRHHPAKAKVKFPLRNRICGNYMRHHVEVHASHREKERESPSASLIEKDPEWSLMWILQRMWAEISSLMKRSRDMNQAKDM